ncbi:MAG: tetratricopeptide repeat protein [Thaumarchaeota archaeon]|nr:MAG: tetratricopeptide repeat protein [Nitrososphaerota archaeon]
MVQGDPDFPDIHSCLGFAYHRASRNEEAVSEFRRAVELSPGNPGFVAELARVLGRAGKRQEAEHLLADLEDLSKKVYVSNVALAYVYESVGRRDEAFERLELAYEEREGGLAGIRRNLEMNELRKDPRWTSIEGRMGFPPDPSNRGRIPL